MTTAITKNEAWESLLEELKDCLITYRDETAARLIELKHAVGEIITTSVYYKKHARGNAKLFSEIGESLNMRATDLQYCVRFYAKHPRLSTLVQTMTTDKSRLTWTDIKESLAGPKEETESDQKCHHIWKCQVCGLIK